MYGGVEAAGSTSSSRSSGRYPRRCLTDASDGGNWCSTEISWAVAVPEGNASCSLTIYNIKVSSEERVSRDDAQLAFAMAVREKH